MKKIKDKITIENALCLYIILCPLLDIISFIFRNSFKTNWSPSTFARPLITIIIAIVIFLKCKFKGKITLIGIIYLIYGIIHLYLFQTVKTEISYSNVIHEAQYIINYSFLILNLFVYTYVFKNKDTEKLKKSVFISLSIYIISIYIAILTGTSSSTYIEKMGYKGWFESGNSLSAIFTLGLFILVPMLKNRKNRYVLILILCLIGAFVTMLIGTRVGLFGFILVLGVYAISEIIIAIIKKVKLNKYLIIGIISGIVIVVLGIIFIGSNTLQRRQHLKDIEKDIVDEGKESHISGSLLEIKEQIEEGTIEETVMSISAQQSILDLYNYANEHDVVNNDMRMQQMIYHLYLVSNQANPLLLLFGNGYMVSFRELVLEIEMLALATNFGLIGFILYVGPILAIFIYASIWGFKNRKKIDSEYLMTLGGIFCSFALSTLSGYTFFNSSSMIFVVVLCTLQLCKISNANVDK